MDEPNIGIIQGRLLPSIDGQIQGFPSGNWAKEFPLAKEASLSFIEWIYELANCEVNPLSSRSGIESMKEISTSSGIKISSVCADYFMDVALLENDGSIKQSSVDKLYWLIEEVGYLGAKHIVLPFVDQSSLARVAHRDNLIQVLNGCRQMLLRYNVELHLELDLPPNEINLFLREISNPQVKIVFDIGNSAALGFDPIEELDGIGRHLGSVHVKDRIKGGGTVSLGSGDADFPTIFTQLQSLKFKGQFTLQVARNQKLSEVELAKKNREFVSLYFN